jgi:hypothetical protein
MSTPEPVVADFATISRWAARNGAVFQTLDDLGRVNRRRFDKGLPSFILASPSPPPLRAPAKVLTTKPVALAPPAKPKLDQLIEPTIVAEPLPTKPPRRVVRSLRGLASVLFDELDGLRDATVTIEHAHAVCEIVSRTTQLIHTEYKIRLAASRAQTEAERNAFLAIAGNPQEIDHGKQ